LSGRQGIRCNIELASRDAEKDKPRHMAKVSAIILIYDIRGFTAASKKLATGDLGKFATAAHRAILELFAPQPPTFVKNLGDGHLLIWETDEQPDPKLVEFIVATANRSRAVFPAFVAGHLQEPGNTGQKLPTQVGIGVVVGEVSKSDDYYGTAVNLAARLQNMSRPEGLAMDQKTFTMAGKREELIKRGFRKARVGLKGLGTTTVWVDRPFSWARLGRSLVPYAIAILAPFIYILLADAILGLPGGDVIRNFLDRHEVFLLRKPHLDAEIRAVADSDRREIAKVLLAARIDHGLIAPNLRDSKAMGSDMWGTSQAVTGLLKAPHLDLATRRQLLDVFDYAFTPEMYIEGYGWLAHADVNFTEAEPTLWTIAALACALGTPGLIEGDRRATFDQHLTKAQSAAMRYRPRETGAWNIFPNQKNLDYYSPYSTTLALLALLEVRAAGLPWQGSVEKRDSLLASTAQFLIGQFEEKEGLRGWRRTAQRGDPISEGLTFQIYAELLRAEVEAGIALPQPILEEIPGHLARLHGRTKDASYDMGEYSVKYTSHEQPPREASGIEGINFLWHPWAIEAAMRWLQRSAKHPVPNDQIVRVRRALGWLVVDMSDDKRKAATEGMSFVAGETLYGLSTIPVNP
jgi:class 3 adenylate cyclase